MHNVQLKTEHASTVSGDTLHYTGRPVYRATSHRTADIEAVYRQSKQLSLQRCRVSHDCATSIHI